MKKLNKNKIGDILALTPMQEGLLYHYLKDPGSRHYFEQLSLKLAGEIDIHYFENAWNFVIETNEMLRTVFRWEETEKPVQMILRKHRLGLRFYDLSGLETGEKEKSLANIKNRDREEGFDLLQVPFRVILIKMENERYEMVISNHHILYDGWSNGIILREFFLAYPVFSRGETPVKPVKTHFREFLKWLQGQNTCNQKSYWQDYLRDFETPSFISTLTGKRREPGRTKREIRSYRVQLSRVELENFARKNKITLASLLYSAWGILLQKYSNRSDVVFGTTVSGRPAEVKGIEDTVGLFINTVPLRAWIGERENNLDFLVHLDRQLKEREQFESTPLVDIKGWSELGGYDELFDAIVVIENYPLENRLLQQNDNLVIHSYTMSEATHYAITAAVEMDDDIVVNFSYDTRLFAEEAIDALNVEMLAQHFKRIVDEMARHPLETPAAIDILLGEEKRRILYDFNNREEEYPTTKTLQVLFAEQARKTPNYIALVGADSQISPITLSYKELNEHSDHLAVLLIEKGVLACNVVGIMMERSIDLIIGILGILKAGCAYLPINPGNPQERIDYMLKDSGAKLLVTTNDKEGEKVRRWEGQKVLLEEIPKSSYPLTFLPSYLLDSSNLAYIIYTSGSTGMPKGVPITHANLSPLLHWGYKHLGIGPSDRTIQNLSYYFDWSVWEIFITLTTGASLYMVPEEVLMNPAACIPFIIENKITVFHVTPTQYRYFVHAGRKLDTLKYLFLGAEKLTVELLRRSFESVGENCRVFNMYGPTEATIISAVLELVRGEENKFAYLSSVPIGGPLGNGTLLVLDKDLNLSPVNIPGELYIGGDGVAMGYLNNPELTAERFNRSYKSYGTYIFYKTGDLARWLNNGAIEFLGRIDQQVKIRGFRIELGEIESRLAKHTAVKEAVVTIRPGGSGKEDNYLCAYIVPHSASAVPVAQLREFLSRTMPDYMIPAHFVMLEKIPLNPNGKLDQRALPEPEILSEEEQVMPRNETEVKLAEIWSGILGIDRNKIGIDANFFHLGGHSLKLTQLSVRVHRELGIRIPLSELFKLPTIRTQSDFIGQSGKVEKDGDYRNISIQPMPQQEYYDLSYAQRRLWIICQFEEDSIAYNEVGGLTIKGKFAPEAFDRAIKVLVQRHEIFRTVFVTIDGEPKQKILPEVDLALQQEDLRRLKGVELEAAAAEIVKKTANKAFNLEKGPLAIFKLLRLEDEHFFLLVNIHHIINDGWSVGVIKHELNILYDFFNKNRSANEEIPLTPVTVQYKDYTLWHNSLIAGGNFDRYKGYWLEKLKDKPTGIELPLDHPRGAVQTFNGGRVYYRLEAGETTALRALSGSENTTIFMKLMALLGVLLHKYSGEKDIILGSPIANRKQPELHHMIGFLVNTLVYRIPVEPGESFQQLLAKVKEENLACYENQDYPFDTLVESLGLARDMSRSPLFNVLIAFGDADTRGEDIRFDWAEVEFHDQVEGFNPSVFDLVFFFNEKGARLDCEIMYNSDLFERNSIERLAANFITLVKHVLGNSEKAILELDYIDQEEYKAIVHRFNSHREEFFPLTIQELVEQQVEKSFDSVAVVSPEGWAITYDEINQRANQLALYLRKKYHIEPGKVIGICIERSLEMIIAVLGVVKSGAAYLSFDPNYPKDRVQHMIEDSRAGLVIVDQSRPDLFDMNEEKGKKQALLDIHQHWSAIGRESDENPNIENELSDAVYVIYTSGSTGTPNGAMLSHALLSNLIQWQIKDTAIDCSLRCLQFTSINFCVSFQEIFTTFCTGGEVHLIGDIERQDINYLMEFLARRKIGNLYLPFSYLNFLFNLSGEVAAENYLRHIITAGEQLKITGGLKQFLEQNPHVKLHNHYGSSEMHVVTSYTLDAATASLMPVPPAGKPIANTRIYILDEYERPVPMGVWGELFVDGGDQVLGYIHNPVLTDKKLVWHPLFSPLSGHRLYRSGDVGRWLEDGNIELKGRKDFQVKIRGFRVELSEIESKILALDKVKDCVVVVKENAPAEKTLVAYIVGHDLDIVEIKRHLGSYLPQYMIPKLMVLESLPLMPNGKVDREKLPELPTENEMMKIIAARPAPDLTLLRGQIRDFDSLPMPDRSLVNYDKYGKNIGLAMVRHTICLQASRGCPYNCLYCHKIWPKKHVFRSAENIFREVELYYNMGVRRFVFVDDIFNLDVRNSSHFFEMVIKKRLDAHFFFPNGLRSDILTEEYIDLMAAGGTRGVGMALESASPRIQRLLKKNLDLDKLRENAEYLCKKHPQIVLELFLMHGFPTETEEEAILTLEFLKALHWIDFPYLHILKIFPNTDMAAMAMENGVTAEAIARSAGLAFHELPETLPFAKSFTLKCQAEFLGDYFLLKERLLDRLPHQMRVLTPEELVEKYNSYLPVEIKTVEDVLEFAGIEKGLLIKPDEKEAMSDEKVRAIDLDAKIHAHFGPSESEPDALRVLLLDLSQYFNAGKKILYDGVEPPLGLMYLLTYLKQELGSKVNGKIAKSRVDFDGFEELKTLLEDFQPQVIGIRTLTYYSRFFHEAVGSIRQWGFAGPIIAGGPYATSDYTTILKDPHVDVVVLSEGELTFAELVSKIIANNNQLPGEDVLKEIAGLAYVPGNRAVFKGAYCGEFTLSEWGVGVSSDVQAAAAAAAPGVGQMVRFEDEIEEKLAGIWAELLDVDKSVMGREDNFFELGGHSLKATTMMTRIQKEFNVRVKLIDIFKAPFISGVARLIRSSLAGMAEAVGAMEGGARILPVEKKDYYVVSSTQKRMYILQQMEISSAVYNMPRIMILEGEINRERLETTIRQLIRRHESFRTSFEVVGGEPVQRVHDDVEFEIEYNNLAAKDREAPMLGGPIIKSFIRSFDLTKAPLLRVGLLGLAECRHLLMVDMHHIISDGVSIEILIKDFMALYRGEQLPVVELQYKDYSEWRQGEAVIEALRQQETYWAQEFQGEIPVLNMPLDYVRPKIQDFAGRSLHFQLEEQAARALKAFALEEGVTLYMVMLSIYSILLAKISSQEDIIIGSPVAGRRHGGLQRIIGMFVNTMAMQTNPAGDKNIREFLREIKIKALNAFANQDYPYEELVEKVTVNRDPGRNPLFDAMFALQNLDIPEIEMPGLKLKPYPYEQELSKFDLSLQCFDSGDGLTFIFEYCTRLFRAETIEKFSDYFKRIISGVIKNPG
ncbi:MAG: hypothetical protein QG657_952, partial [Acidobacteriota bacterium]|nr:hypothetical protein [Acidobacteriota bacterium]